MTRRAKKHDKFLELYAAVRTPRKKSTTLISKMGLSAGWNSFVSAFLSKTNVTFR